jgi:hypothetical protein
MATLKNAARAASASTSRAKRGSSSTRIKDISNSSAQIVKDAAALLDQEVSAGIVAARQMQRRFQKERRIDPSDFKGALEKFQGDAHQMVNSLNDRFEELGSQQSARLIQRLVNHTHDVLDLAVEMVNVGAEIANQLAQSNLKPGVKRPGVKRNDNRNEKRGR